MKKWKRTVALMMSSILFAVALYCPTILNATGQSTEIEQQDVLYEDDFTTSEKYTAALGDTKWQSYKRPIWEDGKLNSGKYSESTEAKFALLNGLGASTLTDYTVEADITAGTANDRHCYVAAYGMITDEKQAGSAYQFTFQGKSGKFNLRTNATTASGNKTDFITGSLITDYFSDYSAGDTIRMSITAVTYEDCVNLICKATYGGETKEIFNYEDTREGRYTCGMPGFGLQQENSSLDNVKVAKVKIVQKSVLYEDDFATDAKYKAALGDTTWQSYKQPICEDGKLNRGSSGEAADAKFALLNGLGADNLMNYTVEADITAGTVNDRICYVAAYGKTTGDKNYGSAYLFAYQGKSQKFKLRRVESGVKEAEQYLEEATLSSFFEDYTAGKTIHMSITAVTYEDYVNLICKATYGGETKEIFNYKDTSATRYTCGMPGFGLQQENSSLDNVKVVKVDESKLPTGVVLYEDDFTTNEKYYEALGTVSWQSYKRPIWDTDRLTSGDYTDAKDAKFALLNGLGAEDWTNYTVEADITAGTANDRHCFVAAYGKTTGNKVDGDAYQFTFQGQSGKFNLRRQASGNAAKVLLSVRADIVFENFASGGMIHMSITAVTYDDYVNLICKATYGGETKEIFNYRDTDEGRYTCGMPGFGLQQQNSSLDDVKVVKTEIVLYEDDFTTDTKYIKALGSTSWQNATYKQPIWEDGKLISGDYTDSKDAKFALLNGLGASTLTDYTVEADITAGTANDRHCYVAAYGTITDDNQAGSAYQFTFQGKSGKFNLRTNATTKSGNKTDFITGKLITDYFGNYKAGDTIRMSITAITYEDCVNLICKATYGGETKEIFNYEDTREGRYTYGMPGFGLQQENSFLDNVKVTLVTLKQRTAEEKYLCLDNETYSVSETGIVIVNGQQQTNGSTLTQAGDYTVAVTADSTEITGLVVLYYQGDATGDKTANEQVDVKDLVRLKRGMEDDTLFTKAGKKAANMNGDPNIDETDASMLRNMLVQ